MAKVREILYGPGYDPYEGYVPGEYNGFGWNSDAPEFIDIIQELRPKTIIEFGTFFGGSAINMANLSKAFHGGDIEVVCVDTFLGSVEHWYQHLYFKPDFFRNGRPPIYNQFLTNVIKTGNQNHITPFPIDSVNGALTLHRYNIQADLVYIDAGHEYESVSQDIKLARHLVRPGGIMLLDDSHYEPIQRAAREHLTGQLQIKGTKIIWRK
jgi:hypothetical protein